MFIYNQLLHQEIFFEEINLFYFYIATFIFMLYFIFFYYYILFLPITGSYSLKNSYYKNFYFESIFRKPNSAGAP